MSIVGFRGPYRFLSNFYPTPNLRLFGDNWPTAEHAYQSMKTTDNATKERIRRAPTPGDARRLGRCASMRSDWFNIRLGVMEIVIGVKFQDAALRAMLLETAQIELVEWNYWQDTYWGVCRGVGENNLGKILMRTRETIRQGASPALL